MTDRQPSESGRGIDLDRLVLELTELARMAPDRLERRIESLSLAEQADLTLRLPAKARLELLLHAPKPMPLVRALPDGDLYLTVREIGPEDALALLKLASADQIHHILDLESWRKDRFDADRSGAWVALLLEAGEPSIKRFLRAADDELLALLFQKWLCVEQLEHEDSPGVHGHGISETGTAEAFVTPDGDHRFAPTIPEHAPAARRILQIFAQLEPERYLRTLWAARWELGSELEETALHWRQSRLEEHGFPTPEESFSIYAAPEASAAPPPGGVTTDDSPVPTPGALSTPAAAARLAPIIDTLGDAARDRVLRELVAVANRLLVADGADSGEPEAHRSSLEKAAGYVGIALELREANSPADGGSLLESKTLIELFREGYAAAAQLQRRARAMSETGWASSSAQALDMIDSPIRERVQALLEPRPLFVEVEGETHVGEARAFRRRSEIQETSVSLEMAEVIGDLLVQRLALRIESADLASLEQRGERSTFSSLFLTLLAWHSSRGELRGAPLPAEVVSDFLRNVASRRTAPPDAPLRACELLLRALCERVELKPREVAVAQAFGRFCLARLAQECGSLDPGVPVDRRFVSCLLLE